MAGVGNAGHGDIVEDHGLGGQAQRIAPVRIRDQDRGGAVVKAARGAGFGHQCAGFKVETALKSGRWSAGWSAAIAVAADVVAGRGISLVFNLYDCLLLRGRRVSQRQLSGPSTNPSTTANPLPQPHAHRHLRLQLPAGAEHMAHVRPLAHQLLCRVLLTREAQTGLQVLLQAATQLTARSLVQLQQNGRRRPIRGVRNDGANVIRARRRRLGRAGAQARQLRLVVVAVNVGVDAEKAAAAIRDLVLRHC